MANAVKGVIAGAKGAPVSVETILVPDPGPGEALVRIQACGVCHTDLHYREGAITNDFPFLLGHEASGIVEKVGPNVTNVVPGDFVILGCGIMAGLGAAINTGGVSRGDSVAVIGCGGVGNAAIAGAKLAGAHTIIGVDVDERKLEWAKQFGATHTINSRHTDPVQAIRDLTGGNGVNVAIEAVGKPETYTQAFHARDHAGTVVLVGVPSPEMKLELPLLEVFGRGGALKSSWYGDCLPTRDFPMFIDLYLQGRLDLERFVSETITLDQVEEAFHKMERGEVLRSVVVF
jgi:S-(hydroxymethyl)mycothiol dehydrogenase